MATGEIDLSHPGWWALGWAVLSNLMAGSVAIYVWISARSSASVARVEIMERELSRRLDSAANEHAPMRVSIARLEESARHAPSHADLKDIYERLNPLGEQISALRAEIAGIHESLDSIKRGVEMVHESMMTSEYRARARRGGEA